VMAALTVTTAMRVVGLLLVSALMVVPVATAQQLTRSFRSTLLLAMALGVVVSLAGVLFSYYVDVAPGASIVVVAILGFVAVSLGSGLLARRRTAAVDHVVEGELGVHVLADHAGERHEHVHDEECGHPAVRHGDHVDYLHEGHRHAVHADHYDEH
jgi:zinc transport system permease protein